MDSTTSERDVPETRDVPLEATPIVRIPRLTREQFAAMWTESSSSEEEEDEVAQLTLPGGGQLPSSPAPGDMRPVSNMSSRYHPSTPLGDRMQDTEESSKATSPASEVDEEPQAGPSRQPGPGLLRYSCQVPIMSPLVLVRCPLFAPCPPYDALNLLVVNQR